MAKVIAWSMVAVASMWIGAMVDFNLVGVIPTMLLAYGGMLLGATAYEEKLREDIE